MDDIYILLDKIDSQLGTRNNNYINDDNKSNDIFLNNRNSMYNNNINYSLNKQIDNFNINDNYNINNSNYYYPNNKLNISQFDKISNGNKEYYEPSNINLSYYQRNEMINSMEKKNEPYSDNNKEDLNVSLIKMQNDLESLKNRSNNIERINFDLDDINQKISKYKSELKYLENETKNTENALSSIITDKKKKDDSINNIHNELEGKFIDLQRKLNLMKYEQDKTGEQLRNSMYDNNYDETISILNNNINKFMVENQLSSQDRITKLYDKIEEQNNEKKGELIKINENTDHLQQEIDIIKQNLNPLADIPQLKQTIQELNNQINNMTNKIGQIPGNTQIIKKADDNNNANNQNMENEYNEVNDQLKDINFMKKNYANKEDLKDINNRLLVIENDLNKLIEGNDDINDNNMENENLININENNNMISKNEFNEEIIKKDNEYNNMKDNIDNKLNEITKKYQLLESQFNEFNEQDTNIQSNYNLILSKIDEKINENKNSISDLNNESQNNVKIFGQIQRNFKVIESEVEKISTIEGIENEIGAQIEEINNRILNLEKNLFESKEQSLNILDSEINGKNDKEIENENLLTKINELDERKNTNMEYLKNKLNELRNEQVNINNENMEQIEELDKQLNEGNELKNNSLIDIEEIDNDNDNMDKNSELENNLDKFQERITLLKTSLEKLYEVEDKNKKEADQQFIQINTWINNFSSNINTKMEKLKNYLVLNLKNLSQNLNDNDNSNDKNSN